MYSSVKLELPKNPPVQTTGFRCENISVQPESSTRNLGVPPLCIGVVCRSGKKGSVHGRQVGAKPSLKSTNPRGVLGVWCTTQNSDDLDIYS